MRKLLGGATVDNIEIETEEDRDKEWFSSRTAAESRIFRGQFRAVDTHFDVGGGWFSEKPFALESRFSVLNGIIMMKKNKNKINRWFVKRIVFDRAALHSSASLAAPFAVPNRTGVIRWCFLGLFGASGGEPGPPATSFRPQSGSGPKKKRSFLLLLRIPADLKGGRLKQGS